MLIYFEKETKADFQEKVGNFFLKPLRLSFGKTVEIRELDFKERETPLVLKVGAILASFLILPITVLLGAVGAGFIYFSKTYKESKEDYQVFLKSTRHLQAKTYIKGIVKFMIFADKQLRELSKGLPEGPRGVIGDQPVIESSYKPFTFNKQAWEKRAESLERISELSAKKIEKECHLDAVEALAEFNINPRFFDPKMKGKSTYLEEILLDEVQLDYQPILNEAMKSVTGRVYIRAVKIFAFDKPILPAPSESKKLGPYVVSCLYNLENRDWGTHYYKRMGITSDKSLLHIDLFKSMREGDRIVIPPDNQKDQFILRLNGKPDHNRPFEKELYDKLRYEIEKRNKDITFRPQGDYKKTFRYAQKVLSEIPV